MYEKLSFWYKKWLINAILGVGIDSDKTCEDSTTKNTPDA